jgi:hypothetical protein
VQDQKSRYHSDEEEEEEDDDDDNGSASEGSAGEEMQVDEGNSGAKAIEHVKRQPQPLASKDVSMDASGSKNPSPAKPTPGPSTVGSGLARGPDGKPVAPIVVVRPPKQRRERKVLYTVAIFFSSLY